MKFKDDIVESRFPDLNVTAQKIATEMYNYVMEVYGKEITITTTVSTKKEDTELSRVSDTHRTRRAFDIRTGDLSTDIIEDLKKEFNKRYGKFGAVAFATPSLIVDRDHGTGPHLHIQLNRSYAMKELSYGQT